MDDSKPKDRSVREFVWHHTIERSLSFRERFQAECSYPLEEQLFWYRWRWLQLRMSQLFAESERLAHLSMTFNDSL